VVTIRHLELAEELFEIEPSATYAARAAAIVAQLAGASAHRMVLEGAEQEEGNGAEPKAPEPRGEAFSVPLRHGKSEIGTLQLWFVDGARSEDVQRLARWGGRLLSRGLAYSRKLQAAGANGSREIDVQALLASTPLTPRERDVVGRLVSGHSTREIAQSTGLTVATVNTYLKRIFAKLGVHSRVELLARVTGTRNAVPATRLAVPATRAQS
jgi:DNA-binding CsgD family transcriptional regulator